MKTNKERIKAGECIICGKKEVYGLGICHKCYETQSEMNCRFPPQSLLNPETKEVITEVLQSRIKDLMSRHTYSECYKQVERCKRALVDFRALS